MKERNGCGARVGGGGRGRGREPSHTRDSVCFNLSYRIQACTQRHTHARIRTHSLAILVHCAEKREREKNQWFSLMQFFYVVIYLNAHWTVKFSNQNNVCHQNTCVKIASPPPPSWSIGNLFIHVISSFKNWASRAVNMYYFVWKLLCSIIIYNSFISTHVPFQKESNTNRPNTHTHKTIHPNSGFRAVTDRSGNWWKVITVVAS